MMASPYIILQVNEINELLNDKKIKSSQEIFFVQFGCSTKAKIEKVGQQPMHSNRNQKLREVVLSCGPASVGMTTSGGAAKSTMALRAFLTTISHIGYLPTAIINGKPDRYGMPSYMIQTKGQREVILVSYADVAQFFPIGRRVPEGEV